MRVLHRAIYRFVEKTGVLAAIGALLLALAGVFFLVNDRAVLNARSQLRAQLEAAQARCTVADERVEQLEIEIPPLKERVLRAEKVVAQLKQLKSTWAWFTGQAAQQRTNQERLAKIEALQTETAAKLVELQQELRRARWERNSLDIERERLAAQVRQEERERSTAVYRLTRWWLQTRGWLCLAAALYLSVGVLMPLVLDRWRKARAVAS